MKDIKVSRVFGKKIYFKHSNSYFQHEDNNGMSQATLLLLDQQRPISANLYYRSILNNCGA
jgi:hypothetical protein